MFRTSRHSNILQIILILGQILISLVNPYSHLELLHITRMVSIIGLIYWDAMLIMRSLVHLMLVLEGTAYIHVPY
jgi:hypothetical protein